MTQTRQASSKIPWAPSAFSKKRAPQAPVDKPSPAEAGESGRMLLLGPKECQS